MKRVHVVHQSARSYGAEQRWGIGLFIMIIGFLISGFAFLFLFNGDAFRDLSYPIIIFVGFLLIYLGWKIMVWAGKRL